MPLLKHLPVLSWRDGLQTLYKTQEPLFKQNLPSNLLYKQRKERCGWSWVQAYTLGSPPPTHSEGQKFLEEKRSREGSVKSTVKGTTSSFHGGRSEEVRRGGGPLHSCPHQRPRWQAHSLGAAKTTGWACGFRELELHSSQLCDPGESALFFRFFFMTVNNTELLLWVLWGLNNIYDFCCVWHRIRTQYFVGNVLLKSKVWTL